MLEYIFNGNSWLISLKIVGGLIGSFIAYLLWNNFIWSNIEHHFTRLNFKYTMEALTQTIAETSLILFVGFITLLLNWFFSITNPVNVISIIVGISLGFFTKNLITISDHMKINKDL